MGIREENANLQSGRHQIIVGTPGRIKDMLGRGALNDKYIKMMILDEADQMLSNNFKDVIYDIFRLLPGDMQVVLVSATMPPECLEVTKLFMRNPVQVLVKKECVTLEGIRQYFIDYEREDWKYEFLEELYETINVVQAVIFCNTRTQAENLTEKLRKNDNIVSCLHGQLDPKERNLKMNEFRTGSSRILITTDLVARGIDVQNVSLVINYDLPLEKETYIHRIGRAGRHGRKGVAINFVTGREARRLEEIKGYYDTRIENLPEDICNLI